MKFLSALIFQFFSLIVPLSALEVVSLHPLISDWARQVGGEKVTVVNLVKPGTELHTFNPTAEEMKALSQAKIILASGKHIEPYLKRLHDTLQSGQEIVEVGHTIPSILATEICDHDHGDGGHNHSHELVDPHWWHDVSNAKRAVKILARTFAKVDPANADFYHKNATAAAAELDELDKWVKAQVATIPKNQRHLVTAHAAFGYFCKAYGFEATHVQGLSRDGEISSRQLADSIRELRKKKIRAVFPETQANPKILSQIAHDTGAKIGPPLQADGSIASYDDMIRGNVKAIVNSLRNPSGNGGAK